MKRKKHRSRDSQSFSSRKEARVFQQSILASGHKGAIIGETRRGFVVIYPDKTPGHVIRSAKRAVGGQEHHVSADPDPQYPRRLSTRGPKPSPRNPERRGPRGGQYLSPKQREIISKKIGLMVREGYPPRVAYAAAYRYAGVKRPKSRPVRHLSPAEHRQLMRARKHDPKLRDINHGSTARDPRRRRDVTGAITVREEPWEFGAGKELERGKAWVVRQGGYVVGGGATKVDAEKLAERLRESYAAGKGKWHGRDPGRRDDARMLATQEQSVARRAYELGAKAESYRLSGMRKEEAETYKVLKALLTGARRTGRRELAAQLSKEALRGKASAHGERGSRWEDSSMRDPSSSAPPRDRDGERVPRPPAYPECGKALRRPCDVRWKKTRKSFSGSRVAR